MKSSTPRPREAVILIHGIWMSGTVDMALLSRRLKACGFRVYILHYAAVRKLLTDNALRLQRLVARVPEPVIHLVGHSLGGLVIRRWLHNFPDQRPGRIVTLGTPHHPSCVAARIGRSRAGRLLLGRGMQALTEELPPWNGARELGVIIGDRPYGIGRLTRVLPYPNDGTVAVDEAVLDHSTATIVLPVTHTSMLFSRPVADNICTFLHTGTFTQKPPPL